MQNILQISSLTKRYAGQSTDALKGISLSIKQGTLFGLIGADGAGKSTLLKICATLISADSGTINILGYDIRTDKKKIRDAIGFMPQRFSLYQDLSVMENINFFADIFGVTGETRKKRIERLLDFSHLRNFIRRRAENLSGGMKQKLSLCCALIHSPKLLILDEPTTGVDPVSRNEFWDILRELVEEGVSILVSTPYMDETSYCDKLAIMHEGEVLCTGSSDELIQSFPHALYCGQVKNQLYPFEGRPAFPDYIKRVYPAAGTFKVVARKEVPKDKVEQWIRNQVSDIQQLDSCDAEMEDVFIEKVS